MSDRLVAVGLSVIGRPDTSAMDDVGIGTALRRIRLRRNDRQSDVAGRAGVSRSTYSAIERGHIDRATLATLRRIGAALEARIDLSLRWRGGDLDRLLRGRHSAMSELVARMLRDAGWGVIPELSFNHFGERGVIDLVAWHAGRRALLLVEIKTEIVDLGDLLGTADRRRRLARTIARERGWLPEHIGTWIVVADSRTNRRRLAARELLRAAFPEDGRRVVQWLSEPTRHQAALWFLPYADASSPRRDLGPMKRVRRRRPNVERANVS